MLNSRPIILPMSGDTNLKTTYDDVPSLVIVGANGSGKSRLGAWIEEHQGTGRYVHRISAQRALTFQDNVIQRPIESAQKLLLYGNETETRNKRGFRWREKPTAHLLNDYDALLSLLYARERQRNADVIQEIRGGKAHSSEMIPASDLEILKRIWDEVMPHRELQTSNDAIKAQLPGGPPYLGSEMSDGERVAIYLMGECLCAPKNAILVIDEPEIHLHRAIQNRLWDQLELERPDCTFVYITHDLDFAAGRNYAKWLWIDSFDGTKWTWEEVIEKAELPSALVFQILGSKKPILFVEGESGSIDRIYRCLFPSHYVIPRGSCTSVIRSVRAMREPGIFSKHKAFGIIDRDRRSIAELSALREQGIYSCPVAEVENLLCIPEALNAVATMLKTPGKAAEAIQFAIEQFSTEVDKHAVAFTYNSLLYYLGRFEEKRHWTKEGLIIEYSKHVESVDIAKLCDQELERLNEIVSNKDYLAVLRVFNRKGLVNQLADKLGLKSETYMAWLFETLENERRIKEKDGLLDAIKAYFPTMPTE